jgi:ATP-dependent Clp protease ATP-binding subunit ClpA
MKSIRIKKSIILDFLKLGGIQMKKNTPLCTSCKKYPGTIHIKTDNGHDKKEHYFCEGCAAANNNQLNPINNILDAFGSFFEPRDNSGQNFSYLNGFQDSTAGKQKTILDNFCIDLTKEAKRGSIDPVVGRESEINRIITI